MRLIAYGILFVTLASIILVPLIELAVVYREKIVLDSAIRNASRVAKDRALQTEGIRDLNADIDEEKFKTYFSEAFRDVMNLTASSSAGNTLTYKSTDGRYETLTVNLQFDELSKPEGLVTEVKVRAEASYIFKTKLMRTVEEVNPAVNYQLVTEREYVLTVRN
ncbi:hypothetical protein I6N90_19835 [Paenibacillus sp. GSMTC-2017]|uniref:hypothetical protein n=1 Tax=Paenibacillus sp. GSMTC-2017 TaxID=2794350 RepID=UPI0018D96E9A|nr:hypothetical protein [Paenibacillus sp. GSMTC-2017]MBH5320057.1 hypothetical protein [Paenibacillus sp. GSMTC-2017]